jgi:hypothetical protein
MIDEGSKRQFRRGYPRGETLHVNGHEQSSIVGENFKMRLSDGAPHDSFDNFGYFRTLKY